MAALAVACGGDSSPTAPSNGPITVSMTVEIISADAATSSRLTRESLSGQALISLETLDELQLPVRRTITVVGGSATVSSSCRGLVGQASVPLPQLDMPAQLVVEGQPLVFDATLSGGSVANLALVGGARPS